ncbi:MAG: nitrous oxide reductase accessory protein NosL [Nitrospirota bacterium]|nr:nitrous oxide reductase accessory protein NosL [Nitrospirota bacterium]
MKRLRLVLFIFLVFAFTLAAVRFVSACPLEGNENTAYEITFTDGKTVIYGCPHCGLEVHATKKDRVKSASARDFISGEWMDPAKMFFIFNSAAIPACSPSWIAFGIKDDAEKFQKGFGGKIYTFDEALKERGMEMKKKHQH